MILIMPPFERALEVTALWRKIVTNGVYYLENDKTHPLQTTQEILV